VTLITAASAPIAPPVAILGLTYLFVKWLSDAVLDNAYVSPEVRNSVTDGRREGSQYSVF
jgi:hypothetical protein